MQDTSESDESDAGEIGEWYTQMCKRATKALAGLSRAEDARMALS
jgi:hypothetical protein